VNSERTQIRFGREKSERGYVPAEGSWESVLVGIRETLPEQIHDSSEGGYFAEQDRKVTMTLREAVFQYYLAGKGHITLATMIINSFPEVRANMLPEMQRQIISNLANTLYDKYPEKYKKRIKK
jgi:hypothetical protein